MRVLLTGSAGYLGQTLQRLLKRQGHHVDTCDLDENVLVPRTWPDVDVALHLAAHKYAALGEEQPAEVAELNITGTANIVKAVPRVVLASTCKAADPCTVYGASKLIAERIVLNAGGTVLRLVNVLGSTDSVLELWRQLPDGPLPVTDCERMWITPHRAAHALSAALYLRAGRYGVKVLPAEPVARLAKRYFPDRPLVPSPLRRGDRPVERLAGEYETVEPHPHKLFVRIRDQWEGADAETSNEEAA